MTALLQAQPAPDFTALLDRRPSVEASAGTFFTIFARSYLNGKQFDEQETHDSIETMLRTVEHGSLTIVQRVIASNAREGWCRDISQEVAHAVADRYARKALDVPRDVFTFMEDHLGVVGTRGFVVEEDF